LSPARARALRIGVRAAGLLLLAYVLAFQVRWEDEVRLVDGTVHRGRVVMGTETVAIHQPADDPTPVVVPKTSIATTRVGDDVVPAVSYGIPSLAKKLASSVPTVLVVWLALFALAVFTAWRWRWLVHALGLVLSGADAVRYTLYGVFFNLAVPGATGGDVVKAYYAAKRTGVPTKAVVSVFVDRLVGLFALVLFAAGALWLGPQHAGYGAPKTLVLAVLAAGVVGGILVASRRVRRRLGLSSLLARLPFQGVLREIDAAFALYKRRPGSLLVGVLVSFVNHAGTCVCAWLLAQALGLEKVTLPITFALVPIASLISAVPLLPGGWGVGEAAFAYLFSKVNVPASEAVGLSVVFRLAILASGLPGGILWLTARDHASRTQMAGDVAVAERAAGALAEPAAGGNGAP
jgi:uncharacterized protein (TIRG00374 family)